MSTKTVYDKMARYLSAESLAERWSLLNEHQRIYAYYLVSRYGWRVKLAVQRAYIHGYTNWPYDYKMGHPVREPRSREFFNL